MIVQVPLYIIVLTTTLAACFGVLIGWGFSWAAGHAGPDKYTGTHRGEEDDA